MAEVTWISAIESLLELPGDGDGSAEAKWIDELVEQYEARIAADAATAASKPASSVSVAQMHSSELAVLAAFRTGAKQAFSTLSKGVHLEFVIDQESVFDIPTILESMKLATKVVTQIAFVSHLSEIAISRIPAIDAMRLVNSIEKEVNHNE